MLPSIRLSRHPVLSGLIVGWLVGVLWWTGLMVALGPSARVTKVGGEFHEEPITVASRVMFAPVVAIPWAIVGTVVGGVSMLFRSCWVPIFGILGTIGGGVFSLLTCPFDGWLTLTMPVVCFAGTMVGSVIGIVIAWARRPRAIAAPERSD